MTHAAVESVSEGGSRRAPHAATWTPTSNSSGVERPVACDRTADAEDAAALRADADHADTRMKAEERPRDAGKEPPRAVPMVLFFYLRLSEWRVSASVFLRLPFGEPPIRRLRVVAAASSQRNEHAAVGELRAAARSSQPLSLSTTEFGVLEVEVHDRHGGPVRAARVVVLTHELVLMILVQRDPLA